MIVNLNHHLGQEEEEVSPINVSIKLYTHMSLSSVNHRASHRMVMARESTTLPRGFPPFIGDKSWVNLTTADNTYVYMLSVCRDLFIVEL